MVKSVFLLILLCTCAAIEASTDTETFKSPQLFTINNLQYLGAFKLDIKTSPEKLSNKYASAIMALSENGQSFFFGGRKADTSICEYYFPELVNTTNFNELKTAKTKQDCSSIIGTKKDRFSGKRIPSGNPQKLDRLTGMVLLNGSLIVNATQYYDAPANNTDTTLIVSNANDLAKSDVKGFYSLQGSAHASGWISKIPENWQPSLKGDYIVGWASNFPIAKRNSIGPSAFVISSREFFDKTIDGHINTTPLINYDLKHRLDPDSYNNKETIHRNHKNQDTQPIIVGNNHLWTTLSWAAYGFIIPNTSTYAVFGSSGGHTSGIGYKINQDNGYRCPGPCAVSHNDYYNYYWLYDVNDMQSVLQGKIEPYSLKPYDYGKFPAPFQNDADIKSRKSVKYRPIRGGTYDDKNNILYLVLGGPVHRNQVIIAYRVNNIDETQ